MIGTTEDEELQILRSQVKHYERQCQLLRQTLMDEFAMRAMQGMLARTGGYTPEQLAALAYIIANAMIEASNAKP